MLALDKCLFKGHIAYGWLIEPFVMSSKEEQEH